MHQQLFESGQYLLLLKLDVDSFNLPRIKLKEIVAALVLLSWEIECEAMLE